MALVIHLKKGAQVIINGAVLENVSGRLTPGVLRSTSVAARSLVIGLFVAGNADSPEATALTRILCTGMPAVSPWSALATVR
jgi:hypothetical protein